MYEMENNPFMFQSTNQMMFIGLDAPFEAIVFECSIHHLVPLGWYFHRMEAGAARMNGWEKI